MSEQLLVRLTKLIEQILGNVLTYTMKHKETRKIQALSTEICLRQVLEDRQIKKKESEKKIDKKKLMLKNKRKKG